MLKQLQQWQEHGMLRPLDVALARFIAQQTADTADDVLLAAALVSERNGHGHVCLDIDNALAQPDQLISVDSEEEDALAASQQLKQQLAAIEQNRWLQQLSEHPAVSSGAGNTPFVLQQKNQRHLLYLRRYWQYEQDILHAIETRLTEPLALDENTTQTLIGELFKGEPQAAVDWQKVACLNAARHQFAIITGGPGTGKTTTVIRLLALLQGLNIANDAAPMRIHLAAPTGKAAARLSESIAGSVEKLELPTSLEKVGLKDHLPQKATTLHRLLGAMPNSNKFKHNQHNPLITDCVIVDEASMMDVQMMSRLVHALPDHARLILLGDKDQLASVEAGSVLGDLCLHAEQGNYTPATAQWLANVGKETIDEHYINPQGSALAQATSMLRYSYRFAEHQGIGALADIVNSGTANIADVDSCIAEHDSLAQTSVNRHNLAALQQLLGEHYAPYLRTMRDKQPTTLQQETIDAWASEIFKAHNQFQLLTATRKGRFGVEQLNQLAEQALQKAGLLADTLASWYPGRPVLITRNNYSLNLMNGDLGICLLWPDGKLRVAFPQGEDKIRWFLPSRLDGVETVFAMTVHKSQGSEFTHTALILPEYETPMLSKELIYTAITRSKEKFTLINTGQEVLATALHTKVQRSSGFN